ncbi:MAG: bifunctional serine/threonine-protein kinase/formylglycine-generating enzyme family protein [Planctomycetota bacterium]
MDPHHRAAEDRYLWALETARRYRASRTAGDAEPLERWLAQFPDDADLLRGLVEDDVPAAGGEPSPSESLDLPEAPTRLGPFAIECVLGSGGMGTVYLAVQRLPVERRVALKVIKLGMDTAQVLQRFALEQRTLGAMNHDGIAKVFDAGVTDHGQPWFAMELVEGAPITHHCDARRAALTTRVRLFQRVCDAVQHAHQKGVIHRDLKPSNLLVSDDGTKVKVIDFGVALALDANAWNASHVTEVGLRLGTPTYMSPEQAAGDSSAVDTRSDVFSLGVVLHELLAGRLPPSLEPDEDAAAHRGQSLVELRRRLRGDLRWIVERALSPEPERRYRSPNELAQDLQRHLDGVPVQAAPPGLPYVLRKFVQRHRGRVMAMAAVAVACLLGLFGTLWFALQAQRRAAEFDLLAGVVHLESVRADEATLWPPWPEQVEPMRRWIREDVARLFAMQSRIAATVAALAPRATADAADTFLHDTLDALHAGVEVLRQEVVPSVETRLRWAEGLAEATTSGAQARAAWHAARMAIARADDVVASRAYRGCGIELTPQTGLLPIGMNPVTKLWEFYDLRSAATLPSDAPQRLPLPRHRPDGSLEGVDDGGIVFVLLPGGSCTLGAQARDPAAPRFDRFARDDETPTTVELAPFFLARHEVTQGQWQRLTGTLPALHALGQRPDGDEAAIDRRYPLEHVDWETADLWLRRHGLRLPSEAEWEYGCRGGRESIWWSGDEPSSLAGVANVLDLRGERHCPNWGRQIGDFDDGFTRVAPVGSFRANPFGLYDVHGNVWEWCEDLYARRGGAADDRGAFTHRVARGGCFGDPAQFARSAIRYDYSSKFRGYDVGMRAARSLQP